jgi:hypothetical protein
MRLIATGLNAFDTSVEPEAVVKFLSTPLDVLEFVTSGVSSRSPAS